MSTKAERELSITESPAYASEEVTGFVDSMLRGCTSSVSTDGLRDALEDGSIWGWLCESFGDDEVQGALDEIHALLAGGA